MALMVISHRKLKTTVNTHIMSKLSNNVEKPGKIIFVSKQIQSQYSWIL